MNFDWLFFHAHFFSAERYLRRAKYGEKYWWWWCCAVGQFVRFEYQVCLLNIKFNNKILWFFSYKIQFPTSIHDLICPLFQIKMCSILWLFGKCSWSNCTIVSTAILCGWHLDLIYISHQVQSDLCASFLLYTFFTTWISDQ